LQEKKLADYASAALHSTHLGMTCHPSSAAQQRCATSSLSMGSQPCLRDKTGHGELGFGFEYQPSGPGKIALLR
jgi:hypothetical protein